MMVLILSFIFSFPIIAMKIDEKPGSRSLIVINHPSINENIPAFLTIRPRYNSCYRQEKDQLCTCYSDYNSEDQPSVQGNALIALAHYQRFGSYFPAFSLDHDEDGSFIKIPGPEHLASILADHGYDHVVLVPGETPVTTDEYFALLAQGKIPLAKIALKTETLNQSMLYQSYFHDVFNHLFLWIALPPENQKIIVSRANIFIDVFASLLERLRDCEMALNYIEVAKFLAAAKLDVHMGNLNNILFEGDEPFNLINASKPDPDFEKAYQAFMNFGLHSKKAYRETILDPADFVMQWLIIQNRSFNLLLDNKKHEKRKNLYTFYADYEGIKKNAPAHKAFLALMNIDDETMRSVMELIIKTAGEILDKNFRPQPFADLLPSFPDFCQKIEGRYKKTLDNPN